MTDYLLGVAAYLFFWAAADVNRKPESEIKFGSWHHALQTLLIGLGGILLITLSKK